MKAKYFFDAFFFIGLNKLSLCVFDGIENEIFKSEILITEKIRNENLENFCEKFFGDNILKVEKRINNFINEVSLVIHDSNFLQIQASIKKDGKGDKINKHELNRMLFDLKQQIKENNQDKSITYIKINNFRVDKKIFSVLDDDFECDELCLQIDFICLSNKIIEEYSKKLEKYQIRIDRVFSAEYLSKNYKNEGESECQIAARLKYGDDENEVRIIEKTSQKQGFFERFFWFFN
tara:strand:- start:747 stop:1451 length:705 start_codon:yes stop_codon:yes gene_type:complete